MRGQLGVSWIGCCAGLPDLQPKRLECVSWRGWRFSASVKRLRLGNVAGDVGTDSARTVKLCAGEAKTVRAGKICLGS